MVIYRLKTRQHIFGQISSLISIILFHWHRHLRLYSFWSILLITCLISYLLPSGLLFNIKHILSEDLSTDSIRENVINQQKYEQKIAYDWLKNLYKNRENYPDLISNQTLQSKFYNYLHFPPSDQHSVSYTLLDQPKRLISNSTDPIVISILYSKHDTDHRQGKFYIGQLLYHLLKNYHSRFIITLCENNNTNNDVSDEIQLIRQLLPVFIVNSQSNTPPDIYEREKQAHLQCILANFQSFPKTDYLLLLQDDAKPISEQFYHQIISLIDNRIKPQWPLNGHRRQPAFIKIYHPKWLVDYLHPSFYLIIQLFSTSFVLTSIYFCFYRIFIQKNNSIEWANYSKSTLVKYKNFFYVIQTHLNLCYFLYFFLLITLILVLLNHTNVSWTWRSLHPSFYSIYPSPSCCIPGVLFFRETYLDIISYLNSVQCYDAYPIDTAFDDLPSSTQLQTYLIEPNLLHHIGLYSRLRQAYINPYLLD